MINDCKLDDEIKIWQISLTLAIFMNILNHDSNNPIIHLQYLASHLNQLNKRFYLDFV